MGTEGDIITGLSNGQTIYVTISDGTNRIDTYKEIFVDGLEEYEYYMKMVVESHQRTRQ